MFWGGVRKLRVHFVEKYSEENVLRESSEYLLCAGYKIRIALAGCGKFVRPTNSRIKHRVNDDVPITGGEVYEYGI